MNYAIVGQYALSGVAMAALVAINIWGVQDELLNAALLSVITAGAWGGVQRSMNLRDK